MMMLYVFTSSGPRRQVGAPVTLATMRALFLATVAATLTASAAQAQRLPATVRPHHYDLAFAVDLARERFDGTETIQVQVEEPTSRIVLNALDITFRDVTIGDGAAAQPAAPSPIVTSRNVMSSALRTMRDVGSSTCT